MSLTVRARSIFGLIGPNGAGKTTVFNLVTGVYTPDAGSIRFGDADLARLAPAAIAARGIARTFQNIRLFAQLTVLENLLVACELTSARGSSPPSCAPGALRDEERMRDRALELLRVFASTPSPTSRPPRSRTATSGGSRSRAR